MLLRLPEFVAGQLRGRDAWQGTLANGGWLLSQQLLRMGVGLVLGVWIARYLGPLQYGELNYSVAFVALFSGLSTLGLTAIVIRDLVLRPEQREQIMIATLLLRTAGAACGVLVILVVAYLTQSGDTLMLSLIAIAAWGTIFQSFDAIDFWFQSQLQAKYSVYAKSAAFLIVSAGKVVLLLVGAPLIAFGWMGLIEFVLAAIGLYIAYRARGHTISLSAFQWPVAKNLVWRSFPLFLSGVAIIIYVRLDVVMLGQLVGQREAGIYSAATKLSEAWYFLPTIIVASVAPAILRMREVDSELYLKRLRSLYFMLSWLAIAVALPFSLLAPWVVDALYGPAFKDAGPVLAIHLWASVAVFLGIASGQHLLAEDLQAISFYRTLVGLVSNVLMNLVLIPRYGAIGAAIATVVSYSASTLSLALFSRTRKHTAYVLLALIPPR
ncbi:MAG: flippase [Gemmatimonadaceae bacterium]